MLQDSLEKLIIITAPSGAGKSSIVKYLLAQFPTIRFCVSACTRLPRQEEVDGLHYHFISVESFKQKIEQQQFAEYEMVYEGKYYGTLKTELQEAWQHKRIPLVDIDVQGAMRLIQTKQYNTLSIFVKPPSIKELENRLRKRGSETEDMIQERVKKADYELSFEKQFQYTIVNDVLAVACEEAKEILKKFIG